MQRLQVERKIAEMERQDKGLTQLAQPTAIKPPPSQASSAASSPSHSPTNKSSPKTGGYLTKGGVDKDVSAASIDDYGEDFEGNVVI